MSDEKKKRRWEDDTEFDQDVEQATTAIKKPVSGKKKNKTVMKPFVVKMDTDFQRDIADHFEEEGLNFSAGVRLVLHRYAKDKRLR